MAEGPEVSAAARLAPFSPSCSAGATTASICRRLSYEMPQLELLLAQPLHPGEGTVLDCLQKVADPNVDGCLEGGGRTLLALGT